MIEAEQALQPIGILLVALQAVDQRELLVDQRPAAPRQRLEHVAHLQLQPGLLTGQQDSLLVQLVDGVRDLTDLLGGVHRDRLDGAGVRTRADVVEFAGQVVVRNPQRAVAQPAQRTHQRARHQDDEQQRQQHRADDDRGVADRRAALRPGLALHRAGHRTGRIGDDLVRDLVGGLNGCAQVRVVDQHRGRVGHDRHPLDHLGLQLLRLGRADAEHLAHPEQRRRLGAGEGDHRRAQLGLGQLTAEVHQQLLHHHLAAGTDRAAEPECLGADALVVDADRAVDRVLGGQQDRRIGGHPFAQPDAVRRDLVHQRLAARRSSC